MGNCAPVAKKGNDKVTSSASPAPLIVRLYGPDASPITSWLRVALLYKTVTIQFCPSSSETPSLQCGPDTITGSTDAILKYIDSKLPGQSILESGTAVSVSEMPGLALATALQHRSVVRHLESMVAWAEDVTARGGRGNGEAAAWRGSPRMEMRRLGRSYSQLVEILFEHAQMEERLIFPVLERADRGLCKIANEEHARDLPIMNGIKEDIKSIIVLDAGSPIYQEALLNLSLRLKTLIERCKEHFEEEERELLPMLEVAERSVGGADEWREEGALEQMIGLMEGTHSHLFHIFMAGLLPQEAMQYIDLVCRCRDRDRVAKMLRSLAARMEAASSSSSFPSMLCNLLKSQ